MLSGVKTAVPAAPQADLFLVPAASADGVIVFLVAPSDPGVAVQAQQLTDFAPAGRLVLEGVVLGSDRVLGRALMSRAGWWRGRRWACARCRPGWSSGRWS